MPQRGIAPPFRHIAAPAAARQVVARASRRPMVRTEGIGSTPRSVNSQLAHPAVSDVLTLIT